LFFGGVVLELRNTAVAGDLLHHDAGRSPGFSLVENSMRAATNERLEMR
jgi:hypothetical protein